MKITCTLTAKAGYSRSPRVLICSLGKKCLAVEESPDRASRVENFRSTENGVMVLAYPKAGSHLLMSIVDQLGRKRLFGLVDKPKTLRSAADRGLEDNLKLSV